MSDYFRTQNHSTKTPQPAYKLTDEVMCSTCKKSNLDRTECIQGHSHSIQIRDFNDPNNTLSLPEVTNQAFNTMVEQFYIDHNELTRIGLQRKILYNDKEMLDKSADDYISALTEDPIYKEYLDKVFNKGIVDILTKLETAEKKAIRDKRKKKSGSTEGEVLRHTDNIVFTRFTTSVSKELKDEIFGGRVTHNTPSFVTFINTILNTIFNNVLHTPLYTEYIGKTIGSSVIFSVKDLYMDYCLEKFVEKKVDMTGQEIYDINTRSYISVEALTEFFSWYIVSRITSRDMKSREFFIGQIDIYRHSTDDMNEDIRDHLCHFIRTKCLKRAGAESFIDTVSWRTPYMRSMLQNVKLPYHHTLDVALKDVVLKYTFHNPFTSTVGFRSIIEKNQMYQVYEFLELYSKLQVSDRIKAIIYKQDDDIRVKKSRPLIDIQSLLMPPKYHNYTVVYLNEEDSPHAIFDHRLMTCTITGTSGQIKELVEILNTNTEVELKDGDLVLFRGSLELVTRARLIKPFLQEFFLMKYVSRYFYPCTSSLASGNYVFVYTPENYPVPRETNSHISFSIENEYEKTSVAGVWTVSFEGTNQQYILPFLSMFIALLQMMENVVYDERFVEFHRSAQAYINHDREVRSKKSRSNTTTIDTIISKKDVYLMLLRETGLTSEQVAAYNDRSRPIPVKISASNRGKWKTFFASVYSDTNYIFGSPRYPAGNMEKIEEKRSAAYDTIQADAYGKFSLGAFTIGDVVNDYTFFIYPEGSSVHPIERLNISQDLYVLVRGAKHINRDKSNELAGKQHVSSNRNHSVTPRIQEVIEMFTNNTPKHITFLRLQDDSQTFAEFVNTRYSPGALRALVAQHLWDHTDEEIQDTLRTMNLFLHQDLVQNVVNASILCFVQSKEGYVYQMPRHNQWYATSKSYERVMFLFRSTKGSYAVATFNTDRGVDKYVAMSTPINMKNFIRSSLMSCSVRGPCPKEITSKELNELVNFEEHEEMLAIRGQIFDTNGKSIGIRVETVHREADKHLKKVMDIRFSPQAPIMPISDNFKDAFVYLSDVKTNVTEKFGKFKDDPRFTLIPSPTSVVRYKVSDIYNRSREWKQRNYIFCRMVITYWLFLRNTIAQSVKNPEGPMDDMSRMLATFNDMTVKEFVNDMIVGHTQDVSGTTDTIMTAIVPEIHTDFSSFVIYLKRVYPSVFYGNGLGGFHVDPSELSLVRDYMERELDIIQTYPPEFATRFMNMRTDTKLIERRRDVSGEIIGREQISDDIHNTMVKSLRMSNVYYKRITHFDPLMDPLSELKKGDKVEKAELFMIEHERKLYFLRLTKVGFFEVACHICHMWKTRNQLLSYNETTTRDTSSRVFKIINGVIVERDDTKKDAIKATGEDYWVVMYTRPISKLGNADKSEVVYAAMLPLE
jgi:hypothetical protein